MLAPSAGTGSCASIAENNKLLRYSCLYFHLDYILAPFGSLVGWHSAGRPVKPIEPRGGRRSPRVYLVHSVWKTQKQETEFGSHSPAVGFMRRAANQLLSFSPRWDIEVSFHLEGSVQMRSKPLIGLNLDYRSARKDAPAYAYLCAGYFDCIQQVGGIPVIIPPLDNEKDLSAALNLLQGFVMIGGADLDPRNDGFMLHPSVRPLDARREKFDRMLMRLLSDRRLPFFGIGVGMQLLNVSQGGNLYLHLPEDLPTAIPHKEPNDAAHRHALEVVPGSLMERVFGDGEIRVNSMHHMAIDEVAPGFAVTARCPDGVIEAIESEMDDWFAIGTQFHPEAETASALDVRIFEEFVDGVKTSQGQLRLVA